MTNNQAFPVTLLINENGEIKYDTTTTNVNTFNVFDPLAEDDVIRKHTTDGFLIGYVNSNTQQARMTFAGFNALNLQTDCAQKIRQHMPKGCVQVQASIVTVRSHPTLDGKPLGSIGTSSNDTGAAIAHTGTYWYFDVQTDSTFRVIDGNTVPIGTGSWYQLAPFGYGKDGNSMWVRESIDNTIYLTTTACSQNSTLIDQIGPNLPDGTTEYCETRARTCWAYEPHEAGYSKTANMLKLDLQTNADVLTYILSCESGYDVQQAKDIAYIIRSRMISGTFPDDIMDVVSQLNQWHCWGDDTGITNYNNAVSQSNPAISVIRDTIVPELLNLPVGGLGQLTFTPSNRKFEYGLYTLGDQLYNASEFANYQTSHNKLTADQILQNLLDNRNGLWKPNSCADKITLERIYIDHSAPNPAGFTTIYLTDYSGCEVQ